jgi:hypothetical protein
MRKCENAKAASTPALSHFRTFALSHFRTFALSHSGKDSTDPSVTFAFASRPWEIDPAATPPPTASAFSFPSRSWRRTYWRIPPWR